MPSCPLPKITDYLEVLQKSRACLLLPELKPATILPGLMGRPKAYHGAFAVVVPLGLGSKTKVIRMFTQSIDDAEAHYNAIGPSLQSYGGSYFVDFAYHAQGIVVGGQTYPVLVMDWLEGQTLKTFVNAHLNDKARLLRLADAWRQMLLFLLDAKIAHGDLQEANVFVQTDGSGDHLRLLDYDSLVIPALEGRSETVLGVPAYQHPKRPFLRTKSLAVDTFSAVVIDLSLRALASQPELWDRWDLDEADGVLLFDQDDYIQGPSSPKFQYLRLHPELKPLVEHLLELCQASDLRGLPSLAERWTPPKPPPSWLTLAPTNVRTLPMSSASPQIRGIHPIPSWIGTSSVPTVTPAVPPSSGSRATPAASPSSPSSVSLATPAASPSLTSPPRPLHPPPSWIGASVVKKQDDP